jgi:ABC-type transport system substrate-binding protein
MTRLDRRALFASGAAAALLSATGVSLAAAPRRGGRLRIAVPRDGSLDQVVRGAISESLTEIAPDGVLRGALATGWQGSEDARVWVFDLRDNVRFHDGQPFGAGDVVATLQPALGPSTGIEATGALRVRLELPRGNPDLPYLLADPAMAVMRDGRMGTGTYRVARLREEREFLGLRVQDHHRDAKAGWADSVEAVVIPDAAIRAEALRDGFVDVAHLPRPEGLIGHGEFHYHPSADRMVLAARSNVGVPGVISGHGVLDGGRIAERWWMT